MIKKDSHLSDQDLLLAADGELSARREGQVRRHLQACWTCRKRMADLQTTISNFVGAYHAVVHPQLPPENENGREALLRRQLNAAASSRQVQSGWPIWRWRTAATLGLLVLSVLAGTLWGIRYRQEAVSVSGLIPNPNLTPGEATATSRGQVCQVQSLAKTAKLPDNLREAVFSEYGMKDAPRDAYEVDFLITPELGGSASLRNLWPEPYHRQAWDAHAKDKLEDRLHSLVCSGNLDLATAQHEIASNWVNAYKKYVGTDHPI